MHDLPVTTRRTVASGCLFLLSIGGYYALHGFTFSDQAKLVEVRQEVAAGSVKEDMIRSVKALVRETEDERRELEAHLLRRDDPTPFLTLLEGLGNTAGVTVEVSSLTEVTEPEGKEIAFGGLGSPRVTATVEIEGGFAQLYHFLRLVELMPYALTIERVALERNSEDQNWSGILSLTIPTR